MRASRGEIKIEEILTEAGLNFKEEYSFPGLVSINGRALRFDFAVFDDNGELDFLIEFQGIQHYEAKSKFGGLSYTIKGYTQENVAIIETRDFGQVQIFIGAGTEGKYTITLKSLERKLIHTGLCLNIPENCEIQVRPRSGMALKHGLSVLNTPGTVDSNYVNEVCIIAVNLSKKDIVITSGDRIAQAVLMPVYCKELVNMQQVEEVESNKSRNLDGFGSTGVK